MANTDNNGVQNGGSEWMLSQAEGSMGSILEILLRRRWTILLTSVAFLLLAFVYIQKATPIYKSESSLYVEQAGPKIITEYEGLMARSGNYLYTQAELLKSTPVLGDVADSADIVRLKTFAGVDNLVGFIRANMNATVGRKDDIITVSFESPYPEEAALVVNKTVDAYVKYQASKRRDTASEVLRILQSEKLKLIPELELAYDNIEQFTLAHGIISLDNKGGNIVFERLSALSNELSQAEMATLMAKADFDAVKSMESDAAKIRQFAAASTGAGVGGSASTREAQLRTELRQAETELKDALYHCTEEHPSVQAIRAKIDRINQELDQEAREFADAYTEVMRLRYVTAGERESEVRASFDTQLEDARELGSLATEYSRLTSQLNRAERACETIDNRIKDINPSATEDVGALNISILETARVPSSPSKPQKTKTMATALALGLMCGCGLAVLRDWLDFRIRSSEEVSAILGIPVLGVVPRMSMRKNAVSLGRQVLAPIKPFSAGAVPAQEAASPPGRVHIESSPDQEAGETATDDRDASNSDRRIPPQLESVRWVQRMSKRANKSARTTGVPWDRPKTPVVGKAVAGKGKPSKAKSGVVACGQRVHLESKSVVAEAYRTIRTAVFFGAPKEDAKAILVTSPAPGDGKSTLVSNLAIAMAQAGQKTLIIDADFRKPMQHKIFEVDGDKGLSSVLAGRDAFEQAIQPGPVDGLDIMACGPEVPNPSELLNSDAFGETLRKLTEQYDRVIVDSPPVGPVADAQILAAICDVAVLVLRAEKTTRRQAQHARDSLLSVGGHLLGAVVNDVQQRRGQYGYYSSYGNYGYYGKTEKKTG